MEVTEATEILLRREQAKSYSEEVSTLKTEPELKRNIESLNVYAFFKSNLFALVAAVPKLSYQMKLAIPE